MSCRFGRPPKDGERGAIFLRYVCSAPHSVSCPFRKCRNADRDLISPGQRGRLRATRQKFADFFCSCKFDENENGRRFIDTGASSSASSQRRQSREVPACIDFNHTEKKLQLLARIKEEAKARKDKPEATIESDAANIQVHESEIEEVDGTIVTEPSRRPMKRLKVTSWSPEMDKMFRRRLHLG